MHVRLLIASSKGISASNNEVVLGIHIIDERRMSIPSPDDTEGCRIEDIDRTALRGSTYISTSLHFRIPIARRYLQVQQGTSQISELPLPVL